MLLLLGFLLSLYLQNIKGVSPRDAGLFLVFQPLTQALFSAWAGRLSDRRRPEILASIDKRYYGFASSFLANMRINVI